jgi:P2 family phage contractile tail tube protein
MKQFLPSTLSDFQCFFLDESWAGVLNKITPPDIEFKTETFTASGTGGEKDKVLPIVKALKPKLTFSDYHPKVFGLVGNPKGRENPLIMRGSFNRDGVEVAVKLTMQGDWFKQSMGELASGGQEATLELEGSIDMYVIQINGTEVVYLDIVNRIYRTNGVDHWETLRKNLAS